MSDDKAEVKFGADIGELKAGMAEGSDSVKAALDRMKSDMESTAAATESHTQKMGAAFKDMQSSVTAALGGIQSSIGMLTGGIAALVGLLGGGMMFKGAIDGAVKWDEEVAKLSRTLGITMGAASTLNVGLRLVGTTSEVYTHALMMLDRQLRTNERGLKNLGMTTRDANNQLVDGASAMKNALATIQQYKVGQDQNIVSLEIFKRGVEQIAPLFRLNDDVMQRATQIARDYGLEIGVHDVEAERKYRIETEAVNLAVEAMSHKIGTDLMGALTSFASFLNGEGVSAIKAFEEQLENVESLFDWVITQGKAFMEVFKFIKEAPGAINKSIGGLGFGGVAVPEGEGITDVWKRYDDKIDKMLGEHQDRLNARQMRQPAFDPFDPGVSGTEREDASGKSFGKGGSRPAPSGDKGGGKDDLLAQWTEEAQRIKDAQADLNAWNAQMDFQFWAEKIAATKHGSDQWWAIMHKLADDLRTLGAEQQKQAEQQAKQQEATNKNIAAMQKVASESAMKMAKEKYDTMYALGQINATQRAAMEKEADTKAYNDALTAYYQQLAALTEHGEALKAKQSAIYLQMEKLRADYNQKMQKAEDQALEAMKTKWDGYATEVGSALTGMLFHHQTMLQTIRSLEEKFFSYVIDTLLKSLVNAWLKSEAEKLAATQAGAAARSAAEASGTATSVIAQAAAALKSIVTSAAQTFAGIFAFLSPVMGPAAAGPAAGGEAAVLAVEGMVASAEGGWDVPANSFAMLHPREMVLPANLAEGVRNMTGQGGMGGGASGRGGNMNVHIHANDADSFEKALGRSNSMTNRLLKKAIRDYNFPLRR